MVCAVLPLRSRSQHPKHKERTLSIDAIGEREQNEDEKYEDENERIVEEKKGRTGEQKKRGTGRT